jgi:aconitate hydratase
VRFVIAETYERIHRSNLVGMGIVPLQFPSGTTAASLGLDGTESYAVTGLAGGITPGQDVTVEATRADGTVVPFETRLRVDGPAEVEYLRAGGVLNLVLRGMVAD